MNKKAAGLIARRNFFSRSNLFPNKLGAADFVVYAVDVETRRRVIFKRERVFGEPTLK